MKSCQNCETGVSVLFGLKKDGGLRLCVDYRGLNSFTKKNRYPLPLISEALDRLVGAKVYTKLDIRDAYNMIRIREGDEWKTAFRTRYGHFEYTVMPFGLVNAPATFQSYINSALRDYLDVFCIAYLDDILIYSDNDEDHTEHVRKVLARLEQHRLYAKLSKCEFHTRKVGFVGFVVTPEGVSMEEDRVRTIREWPEPKKHRDVQVFLGFANFYRRFIHRYSAVARPLSGLLEGAKNGKFSGPFIFTEAARKAFQELKGAFTKAPMLTHYDPEMPIRLETDASGKAISGIISQQRADRDDKSQMHWHPVAYWSRKMTPAERNYDTGDAELLAIVMSCKQWRHYLEGAAHPITILTDHDNLRTVMTTKKLSRRQARWWEILSGFRLEVVYRPGKTNPADAPSRRPDYMDGEEEEVAVPNKPPFTLKNFPEPSTPTPVLAANAPQPLQRSGPYPELGKRSTKRKRASRAERRKGAGTSSAQVSRGDAGAAAGLSDREHFMPGHAMAYATAGLTAYSTSTEDFMEQIADLQAEDQLARKIRRVLGDTTAFQGDPAKVNAGRRILVDGEYAEDPKQEESFEESVARMDHVAISEYWHIHPDDGLLQYDRRLYIPPHDGARTQLLRRLHDDPLAGHFGYQKTLELVRRCYWWPRMARDIKHYVSTCTTCQRIKPARHKPYGELTSLPDPEEPWKHLTMDFITDLPPSVRKRRAYDSVLVVVDRFTKWAKYIPVTKKIKADELADLLERKVVLRMGAGYPASIVSDRGTLFTAQFWSALCYHLKIKRNLSTAFHPQSDGQTERQNQTLEQYLRSYINYQQDDWVQWLPMAEFAYNNAVHASTGVTPFFAMMGRHLRIEEELDQKLKRGVPDVPAARERAEQLREMRTQLQARWKEAVQTQARYHDAKSKPRFYRAGDMV